MQLVSINFLSILNTGGTWFQLLIQRQMNMYVFVSVSDKKKSFSLKILSRVLDPFIQNNIITFPVISYYEVDILPNNCPLQVEQGSYIKLNDCKFIKLVAEEIRPHTLSPCFSKGLEPVKLSV